VATAEAGGKTQSTLHLTAACIARYSTAPLDMLSAAQHGQPTCSWASNPPEELPLIPEEKPQASHQHQNPRTQYKSAFAAKHDASIHNGSMENSQAMPVYT
jgi:hypothetical protein